MARILVIEDDRVQRFAAVRALQAAGHDVVEAVDGQDGLAQARAAQPELVVCDVRMPVLDGYEVLRQLRADTDLYAVPIILLTSMTERESMRQGMASGADDYLTKPFRFDELCEAVSVLLRKRKTYMTQAASVIGPKFEAALRAQTQQIADDYQSRLTRELDNRWGRKDDAAGGIAYEYAAVVMVDVFGSWMPDFGLAAHAQAARRAYDSACDALHLFAPAHVLPLGNLLLAAYADASRSPVGDSGAAVRALRAAWASVQRLAVYADELSARGGQQARVVVHGGPLSLLRVRDVLHGDGDTTLASGATVEDAVGLLGLARQQGWKACCSAGISGLAGSVLRPGRASVYAPAGRSVIDALEVVAVEERA